MAEKSVRDERNISHSLTDKCEYCDSGGNLKVCSRCKTVHYCSKKHQQADWPQHKKLCRKSSASSKQNSRDQGSESMENVVDHIENLQLDKRMENGTSTGDRTIDYNEDTVKGKTKRDTQHSSELSQTMKTTNEASLVTGENSDIGSSEKFILESEESLIKPLDYSKISPATSQIAETMPHEMRQSNQPYFSVVESRNKALGQYVTNCLNSYGVCVLDNFLGDSKAKEIWEEVNELYKNKNLSSGQLVNMVSPRGTVRGDLITWVDGTEKGCMDINFLISAIDAIMLHCQDSLDDYTVKGRSKAMVAVYPENSSGFLRHVDNPSGDGRCVTCIYYLNKNWNSKVDGGLLRIFPEGQNRVANVEPQFDRLLFFWSDRRNPHEVLPSYRTRFAVTVWYYDAEERKSAVRKFKGQKASTSK